METHTPPVATGTGPVRSAAAAPRDPAPESPAAACLRGVAAALVSAFLLALAFPPADIGPLAWVALVPFLVVLDRPGGKSAVLYGLVAGLGLATFALRWMYGIFGGFAVVLHLLCAGSFLVFAGIAALGLKRWGSAFLVWGCAPLWVVGEHFRSELWPLRFAWLGLGYSQHDSLGLLQLCSVLGVYGLTFLIVLVNGAAAAAVRLEGPDRWPRRIAILVALAAVVGGLEALGRVGMQDTRRDVRVACVQGEDAPLPVFVAALRDAAPYGLPPALFVLPEYTSFSRMTPGCPHLEQLGAEARRRNAYVVFGAKETCAGPSPGPFRNTAFVLGPDGQIVGRQAKSVPVQFFDDGLPAERQDVIQTPLGRLGVLICYDLDFPYLARNLVEAGAELLVAPTMDASSWGPIQHAQHFAMANVRAVETRRFVVRCATSGITALFDPYGRTVARLKTDVTGAVLTDAVAFRGERSLYLRGGWAFPWLCWGAVGAIALAGVFGRRAGH